MGFPTVTQERIDRMFLRYVRHQVGDILMSSHSASIRKRVVSEMLMDETTQQVLASYPTNKLRMQQQIIMWLMQHNCQMALSLLFKVKR